MYTYLFLRTDSMAVIFWAVVDVQNFCMQKKKECWRNTQTAIPVQKTVIMPENVQKYKIHRYRDVHGIISIFQTIPSEGNACMRVCNKTATYFTYMLDDFAMSYSLCPLFLKFPV